MRKKLSIFLFIAVLLLPITVSAKTVDELFDSVIDSEGKVTVKSVKPTVSTDPYGYQYNNSMEILTAYFEKILGDEYEIYSSCESDDGLSSCVLQIDSELRDINIVWEEPTENNELITGYLNSVKKEITNEFGEEDLDQFYILTDLALINYYKSSNDSEFWNPGAASRALKFVKELNDAIDNADVEFRMMIALGDQDPALMYEYAGGAVSIYYNGSNYGTERAGVFARRVIYIPEETEDTPEAYVAAAQKRINDYLKDESVVVSYGGRLANLLDAIPENSNYSKDDIIDEYGPNPRPIAYTDLLDPKVDEATTDGNYYNIKIGEKTYKFYIIKADSSKLETPTYKGKNLETNIEITTTDASIPLDTAVKASRIKEDAEIKKALGVSDSITYDISLRLSASDAFLITQIASEYYVLVPVPESYIGKTIKVYYVTASGEIEEYKATPVGNNYISFVTKHFSEYTVAVVPEDIPEDTPEEPVTNNPATGDHLISYIALFGVSIIGLSTVIYKKKESK